MSYITAQFGRPVAKPRPDRPKGKPLTEAELAARWMALCAKEGRISKPKVKADPKKVSGQMVHRVRNGLSDTPRSVAEISRRLVISEGSIHSALVILKDEGAAKYEIEKCTTGNGNRRMWSLA